MATHIIDYWLDYNFPLFYFRSESQKGQKIVARKTETPSDTREELTALKALDGLLRKYDRRSTPTNDQGM